MTTTSSSSLGNQKFHCAIKTINLCCNHARTIRMQEFLHHAWPSQWQTHPSKDNLNDKTSKALTQEYHQDCCQDLARMTTSSISNVKRQDSLFLTNSLGRQPTISSPMTNQCQKCPEGLLDTLLDFSYYVKLLNQTITPPTPIPIPKKKGLLPLPPSSFSRLVPFIFENRLCCIWNNVLLAIYLLLLCLLVWQFCYLPPLMLHLPILLLLNLQQTSEANSLNISFNSQDSSTFELPESSIYILPELPAHVCGNTSQARTWSIYSCGTYRLCQLSKYSHSPWAHNNGTMECSGRPSCWFSSLWFTYSCSCIYLCFGCQRFHHSPKFSFSILTINWSFPLYLLFNPTIALLRW